MPVRAAPLALIVAAALVCPPPCKSAELSPDTNALEAALDASKRSFKSLGPPSLPPGCLYAGRWYRGGAGVPTGEACLQCACELGALSCRRRACAPLPDPLPRRCHVLHRKGACCPELHCPDGIVLMERGASSRLENDDITAPPSITHACVEGGTIYAAGSAMAAGAACEQCFCLRGARRCVRPRCLPAPPACAPRPAPGACCPQRYYCRHDAPPPHKHTHDCKIENKWFNEGERVPSPQSDSNCTQCFCLRGAVQCHPLSCAPPLLGCKPLMRPGECCPHQYQCEHNHLGAHALTISSNSLIPTRSDDRAFHKAKSNKQETTTKTTLTNLYTEKNIPPLSATKNHLISTTKVKRKTSDPPPEISSQIPRNITTTEASTTTVTVATREPTTLDKLILTTETTLATELTTELASTEQPEGSVRIVINGTINCTAELSSTSLPLNISLNDTESIQSESHPRIPLIDVSNLEDHTFSPNDIITDRTVNEGFDENESFVINVTSSLRTNTSHTSTKPPAPTTVKVSVTPGIVETFNSSKKTKGDYDYDYTEPTLPPSLPNLKIIPFVAADAVVEDDHAKETYPILEREDKFPVYYPTADTKESGYATRREDVYRPTQYPVFITDKPDRDQYPSLTLDDLPNTGYSNLHSGLDSSINEFTVSASLGNRLPDNKIFGVTQPPLTTTTFKLETPAVNLFSPPVETEGGFVPKGPTGLIDEYFAVFPSTPSGSAIPHLTTSMQLDVGKGECTSSDGRRVSAGESISVSCAECTCVWGALQCSPRACVPPCDRRDPCCRGLCAPDNKTMPAPTLTEKPVIAETTGGQNLTLVVKPDAIANNTMHTDVVEEQPQPIVSPVGFVNSDHNSHNHTTQNFTSINVAEKVTSKPLMTTSVASVHEDINPINNQSLEYEEEEDEGFSFGSVLKLLLSDSYETTTAAPKRPPTTSKPPPARTKLTTRRPKPTSTPASPSKPTPGPFIPLPLNPYMPPKKNQNPINRIDHLVLGEATAIKTTPRPTTTTVRYVATDRSTTQRISTKTTETVEEETYTTREAPRPSGGAPGIGPGLLKLAGCNIYGRMYRVGRIIAELSTPCQECWCTELGVHCKQLKC